MGVGWGGGGDVKVYTKLSICSMSYQYSIDSKNQ